MYHRAVGIERPDDGINPQRTPPFIIRRKAGEETALVTTNAKPTPSPGSDPQKEYRLCWKSRMTPHFCENVRV
jgi:hypothetical protein